MAEPSDKILVTIELDRGEMRRRGALGGRATHDRHNSVDLTAPGRAAFLSRFETAEARSDYFRDLARKSAQARRERALAASGGAS